MNIGKSMMLATVGFGLAAGIAYEAAAQVKPEVLVKQRKAAMTLIAKYIGPVGAMVQGKIPYDAAVVARNASFAEALSKMPWDGFETSTQNFKETRAKPEIYSNSAKFNAASDSMQTEIGKLAAAARSGDQNAVKAAFGGVGKTCKACHDDFRND
ncbi:MAG: cytochrome c [Betaproteobacteria bacterium]|nr:cytochrome c [Betaproteobacteria bacterium]